MYIIKYKNLRINNSGISIQKFILKGEVIFYEKDVIKKGDY